MCSQLVAGSKHKAQIHGKSLGFDWFHCTLSYLFLLPSCFCPGRVSLRRVRRPSASSHGWKKDAAEFFLHPMCP